MQHTPILDYWFSPRVKEHWFSSTQALDADIRAEFEPTWECAAAGKLDHWQDSPEGALALVIVLDQFPLNMYRGKPKSFSTETKAIAVAANALDKGYADEIPRERLAFLFMPFMHSENLDDQNRSVELYEKYGLTHNLKFAEHHRDLIQRFGRFPHRNAILGRDSTAEEEAYLASDKAFTG